MYGPCNRNRQALPASYPQSTHHHLLTLLIIAVANCFIITATATHTAANRADVLPVAVYAAVGQDNRCLESSTGLMFLRSTLAGDIAQWCVPPCGTRHRITYICTAVALRYLVWSTGDRYVVGYTLYAHNVMSSTFQCFLLEPQSRFGDKPVICQVICPQNATAVLKHVLTLSEEHGNGRNGTRLLVVIRSVPKQIVFGSMQILDLASRISPNGIFARATAKVGVHVHPSSVWCPSISNGMLFFPVRLVCSILPDKKKGEVCLHSGELEPLGW